MTKTSAQILSLFLSASLASASLASCTVETASERESSPIDTVVSQSTTVEVPGGSHDGWLDLIIHDATSADGRLALLDDGFALNYSRTSEDLFVIVNERSGSSLTIRASAADAEFTFVVDGVTQVFADAAALRALDLQRLPEYTLLLLAAQVIDDVDASVQAATTGYVWWLIAAIIVAVVIDACAGTEMTCNHPTDVYCPDGSTVHDPCGCGESVCNKCIPSTCADECVVRDPCPVHEPGEPPHTPPVPAPK